MISPAAWARARTAAWARRLPGARGRGGNALVLAKLERDFYPRRLDLEDAPASGRLRLTLWAAVALQLCLLVWAVVGELDIVSSANGRVAAEQGSALVQTDEVSVIRRYLVQEGQRVAKGDVLVELDRTQHLADFKSNESRQHSLRHGLQRLSAELRDQPGADISDRSRSAQENLEENQLMLARQGAYAAKLAEARNEMAVALRHAQAERALLDKAELLSVSARAREVQAKPYIGRVISAFDYDKLREAAMSLESELAAQQQKLAAAELAIEAPKQHLLEIEQSHKQDILADVQEKRLSLTTARMENEKTVDRLSRKNLLAPQSGFVQLSESNKIGTVLTAGQPILTIAPEQGKAVVEVLLKNEDVGQVKVGQPVDIKIEAFPFLRHGTLAGVVSMISQDVRETDVLNAAQQQDVARERPVAGFRVRIAPARPYFMVDGKQQPLTLGMAATADIKLGRRKIYEYFTSPFMQSLESAAREK